MASMEEKDVVEFKFDPFTPYPDNPKCLCNRCKNWIICDKDSPDVTSCSEFEEVDYNVSKEDLCIDPIQTVEEYISQMDWRVAENANMSYSLSNLLLTSVGKIIAEYWLTKVYGNSPIARMHKEGFVHIHDLGLLCPYCFGQDCMIELDNGETVTIKDLYDNYTTGPTLLVQDAIVRHVKDDLKVRQGNKFVKVLSIAKRTKPIQIVEIVLKNGKAIRLSLDHAVLVKRDDKYLLIPAKNVQSGDKLLCRIEEE